MANQVLAQHFTRAFQLNMGRDAYQVFSGMSMGTMMKVFHAG